MFDATALPRDEPPDCGPPCGNSRGVVGGIPQFGVPEVPGFRPTNVHARVRGIR